VNGNNYEPMQKNKPKKTQQSKKVSKHMHSYNWNNVVYLISVSKVT